MNTETLLAWAYAALALAAAPLLPGITNRVKALVAGRKGPPLIQLYRDLWRLMGKGAVYSKSTSWVFRFMPIAGLGCALAALTMVPFGGNPALIPFGGDMLMFVYLFALWRFLTVLAALDTASAFEGMGASREVQFAALAEPALLLSLASVARTSQSLSLSDMFVRTSPVSPELLLVALSMAVVYLCENARVPFDDPNTHLELTMIHEVMILDHSGPDLAMIEYASALKLWLFGALLTALVIPPGLTSSPLAGLAVALGLMVALAAGVGVVESVMARLRLVRIPHLLAGATALATFAFVMVLR